VTDNRLYTIIPYKGQLVELCNPTRARAIYKNKILNLLANETIEAKWTLWFEEYSCSIETTFSCPRVTNFFYELGFLLENLDGVQDDTLLAIDIEYRDFRTFEMVSPVNKIELHLFESIDFGSYQKLFDQCQAQLLAGNCYQLNLTCEHLYRWDNSAGYTPQCFIASLWNDPSSRGAFGSATFIASTNTLYLSNSPECLFQVESNILSTMPIKGTLSLKNISDFRAMWKKLINDKKNEAELYMIIDLLRNDLSRIELPIARVVKKKLPLLAPGILHQFAKIEIKLSKLVTIKRIVENLFPGGSITGAPKKMAIKLLSDIEKRERKFYCGSTLICFKRMKSASINIRSAVVDFERRLLTYQSGGGITLQSNPMEEYKEMLLKRESFIRAL
jgi:anthranilate/para-aminobenzoate synthase component I